MSGCELAPRGWWCSREEGHDGPCAGNPTLWTRFIYWCYGVKIP